MIQPLNCGATSPRNNRNRASITDLRNHPSANGQGCISNETGSSKTETSKAAQVIAAAHRERTVPVTDKSESFRRLR
jgi:hypothetical protein